MNSFPRLSLRLHGGLTPQECVAQAQAAEAAGFAGVWFAENPFARGILPAAAACAVATRRLTIGIGGFNRCIPHTDIVLRHCDFYLDGEQIVADGTIVPAVLR